MKRRSPFATAEEREQLIAEPEPIEVEIEPLAAPAPEPEPEPEPTAPAMPPAAFPTIHGVTEQDVELAARIEARMGYFVELDHVEHVLPDEGVKARERVIEIAHVRAQILTARALLHLADVLDRRGAS